MLNVKLSMKIYCWIQLKCFSWTSQISMLSMDLKLINETFIVFFPFFRICRKKKVIICISTSLSKTYKIKSIYWKKNVLSYPINNLFTGPYVQHLVTNKKHALKPFSFFFHSCKEYVIRRIIMLKLFWWDLYILFSE